MGNVVAATLIFDYGHLYYVFIYS